MRKYKFQQGGFSDEFYSTISRLAQLRQQQDSQNEEYYVQPQEDNSDDRYSSLEEEIANLKEQISSFQPQQEQPQEQSVNPDSMSVINMVLNSSFEDNSFDEYQNSPSFNESLDWLPTKDKSVNIKGTSSKLTEYLNGLPPNVKASLLAISGNDSDQHVTNSRHYKGEALDFRYNDNVYNYMLNDPHLGESGLKILNPNHGTAKHIHIQTKQFGGDLIPIFGEGGETKKELVIQDNTFIPKQQVPLFTHAGDTKEEKYRKIRNKYLTSGFLNVGAAVAPPVISTIFDVASVANAVSDNSINPLDLIPNKIKIGTQGLKNTAKFLPIGRYVSAGQATNDFYNANLYNDSMNMYNGNKLIK